MKCCGRCTANPILGPELFGPDMFHLVKRFFGSLATAPPNESEQAWVKDVLNVHEHDLWRTQAIVDQRHSCDIARRFVALRPQASRDEIAGVLLHDIGKIEAGLGIVARVIATIMPLPTRRFIAYRHHQERGAQLLKTIACNETTIALVAGHPDSDALRALYRADNI